MSDQGFEKAIKILDSLEPIGPRTQLLPRSICQAVVDRIDAEPKECGGPAAVEITARLLRNYPDFKAHDAKGYVVALKELFSVYPVTICYRATGKDGLPGRLQFVPKTADVKKALDDEIKRRDLIRANALWHMQEADNRAKQRQAEAEFNAKYPNAETRRRQVAELLGAKAL
jgi:hypothetical protein